MTLKIWHYAGCGTCKKARKYLEERGIEHELVPIVEQPPSLAQLKKLVKRSGLPVKRFFNTSGQSYRGGGFRDRLPTMSQDEALAALAADGKLIKRPLVDGGDFVLVGFKQDEWDEALSS